MRRRRERGGSGDDGEDSFTTSQLHHVLADLFGAGTDTALTTIKWIVLYVMLYPDVQVSRTSIFFGHSIFRARFPARRSRSRSANEPLSGAISRRLEGGGMRGLGDAARSRFARRNRASGGFT